MSLRSSVTVFAPATVANVACGFDLLGFALDAPGDEITARFSTQHIRLMSCALSSNPRQSPSTTRPTNLRPVNPRPTNLRVASLVQTCQKQVH